MGRFISADGILGANKDMTSYNLYAYVSNNPIMYSDPSGRFLERIVKKIDDILRFVFVKTPAAGMSKVYNTIKGNTVAQKMFEHGLYGNGRPLSSEVQTQLTDKIMSSQEINKEINKCIDGTKGKKINNCKPKMFKFNSGDLYYSVNKANIDISGIQGNGVWLITVQVWDTYDFTEWKKLNSFGSFANNIGTMLETRDDLIPYDWEVTGYAIFRR